MVQLKKINLVIFGARKFVHCIYMFSGYIHSVFGIKYPHCYYFCSDNIKDY